jgi:hypothetical protein
MEARQGAGELTRRGDARPRDFRDAADRQLAHTRAALERSADSHDCAARLHEEVARLDDGW